LHNADLAVPLSAGRAARFLLGSDPAPPIFVVGSWKAVVFMLSSLEARLSVVLKCLVTAGRLPTSLVRRQKGAGWTSGRTLRGADSPIKAKSGRARRVVLTDLAIEKARLTRRRFLRYTSRTIEVRANRALGLRLMSTDTASNGVTRRARRRRFSNAVAVHKLCVRRTRRRLRTHTVPIFILQRRGASGRGSRGAKAVFKCKPWRATGLSEGDTATALVLEASSASRINLRLTGFAVESGPRRAERRRTNTVPAIEGQSLRAHGRLLADAVVTLKTSPLGAH
jgi:hypothetical protein